MSRIARSYESLQYDYEFSRKHLRLVRLSFSLELPVPITYRLRLFHKRQNVGAHCTCVLYDLDCILMLVVDKHQVCTELNEKLDLV